MKKIFMLLMVLTCFISSAQTAEKVKSSDKAEAKEASVQAKKQKKIADARAEKIKSDGKVVSKQTTTEVKRQKKTTDAKAEKVKTESKGVVKNSGAETKLQKKRVEAKVKDENGNEMVTVKGYTKKDGTVVKNYTRKAAKKS